MDRLEREQLIERLQHDNEDARQRLAEQERQREQDPAAMQDYLLAADVRESFTPGDLMYSDATETPAAGPYARRTDSRGMVFKRGPENAPAPAPAPSAGDDWNAWLRGWLDIERNVIAKAMGTVAAELRAEWQADIEALRRTWQAERRERRVRDQTIVERSGRISELQRQNSERAAELVRKERDEALATRDRRIEQLEIQLSMLMKFIGPGLPRGFFGGGE